jgi:thioredoxin-dependent peroxiredoxin
MTLAINDTAPDFEAQTTEGNICFHDWIGNNWGVLFSHPKDFTGLHHRARHHGAAQTGI